jgi:hypothetical protein
MSALNKYNVEGIAGIMYNRPAVRLQSAGDHEIN